MDILDMKVINQMKGFFINGGKEQKMQAAKHILNLLQNQHEEVRCLFGQFLVKTDMIEILCKALCTSHTLVIMDVFCCLKIILQSRIYLDCNRINLILESIARVIHVSMMLGDCDDILNGALKILSLSLTKTHELKVSTSACNLPLVVSTLWKILQKCNNQNLNISNVLIAILALKEVENESAVILPVLVQTLSNLSKEPVNHPIEQLVTLLSHLGKEIMELSLHQNGYGTHLKESTIGAFNTCLNMTMEVLVPYVIKLNKSSIKLERDILILNEIHSLFLYPDESSKLKLATNLNNAGFLDFLQNFEYCVDCHQEGNSVRSLLAQILILLSQKELGREDWEEIFSRGLKSLPLRSCYTNLTLRKNSESDLFCIVYNYFNLVHQKRPYVEANFLPSICTYITTQRRAPSPAFTKAIWFIFAVALINRKVENIQTHEAIKQLLEFVCTYKINHIFTNHPAILYWAFSSHFVNNELKFNIINIWLDFDDKEKIKDFKNILQTNKDFYFTFLEIIATSNSIDRVNTLEKCGFTDVNKKNEIAEDIWLFLPKLLSNCQSQPKPKKFANLTSLLEFCMFHQPKDIQKSLLLKIAFIVPDVVSSIIDFNDYLETSKQYTTVFHFILFIMEKGKKLEDKTALSQLLKNSKFLSIIETNLLTEDKTLLISILQLLRLIVEIQVETKTKAVKHVVLHMKSAEAMLQGDVQVAVSTVKLLAAHFNAISSHVVQPILKTTFTSHTEIRSIYVSLHMMCSMSEDVSPSCWICMKNILEYSQTLNLHQHLTGLLYTPMLLKNSAPSQKAWNEEMKFVSLWITFLPPYSPKAFKLTSAQKAIIRITKSLMGLLKKEKEDPEVVLAKALGIKVLPYGIANLLKSNMKI